MAKIYYNRIKAGMMTLEEVPLRWRESVRQLLEADELLPAPPGNET